jgi:hypothetical protein
MPTERVTQTREVLPPSHRAGIAWSVGLLTAVLALLIGNGIVLLITQLAGTDSSVPQVARVVSTTSLFGLLPSIIAGAILGSVAGRYNRVNFTDGLAAAVIGSVAAVPATALCQTLLGIALLITGQILPTQLPGLSFAVILAAMATVVVIPVALASSVIAVPLIRHLLLRGS